MDIQPINEQTSPQNARLKETAWLCRSYQIIANTGFYLGTCSTYLKWWCVHSEAFFELDVWLQWHNNERHSPVFRSLTEMTIHRGWKVLQNVKQDQPRDIYLPCFANVRNPSSVKNNRFYQKKELKKNPLLTFSFAVCDAGHRRIAHNHCRQGTLERWFFSPLFKSDPTLDPTGYFSAGNYSSGSKEYCRYFGMKSVRCSVPASHRSVRTREARIFRTRAKCTNSARNAPTSRRAWKGIGFTAAYIWTWFTWW